MQDLLRALEIFAKYTDSAYPTGCEHDILWVYVDPSDVFGKDIVELEKLGFEPDYGIPGFYSYRFG